jgi:hypothetical protein
MIYEYKTYFLRGGWILHLFALSLVCLMIYVWLGSWQPAHHALQSIKLKGVGDLRGIPESIWRAPYIHEYNS